MLTQEEHESAINYQLDQINNALTQSTEYLQSNINVRMMMTCYKHALTRLLSAERFCFAAKALADYKEPLRQVITALGAWETLAEKGIHTE